jgi:hypothetical protein
MTKSHVGGELSVAKLLALAVVAYVYLLGIAIIILVSDDPWPAVMLMVAVLFVTVILQVVMRVVRRHAVRPNESLESRLGHPNQRAVVVSVIPLALGIVSGSVAVIQLAARQAAGVALISLITGLALEWALLWWLPRVRPGAFATKRKDGKPTRTQAK